MLTPTRSFTFIDLFSGLGGFRLALEAFNGRCVFSSDIDTDARSVYQLNFGELPSGDITKILSQDIPAHDVLCAGFPCQPFSISGSRKGFDDPRGNLFLEIIRIAKAHRPAVLFLENVKGLLTHDGGRSLKRIIAELEGAGYQVRLESLHASEYGVPQVRERLYFVCFRDDLSIDAFHFPRPTNESVTLAECLVKEVDARYVIDRDDIVFEDFRPSPATKRRTMAAIGAKLTPGDCWQGLKQVGKIGAGNQTGKIFDPMGHAVTISSDGAYLIDGKVRRLMPRECARIMGFPDSYLLPNLPRSRAHKLFNNSVVIRVLQLIFQNVVELVPFGDSSRANPVHHDPQAMPTSELVSL